MAARIEHAHHRRRQANQQHIGKHHAQQLQHERGFLVKLMRRQSDGNADHHQGDDDGGGDDEAGDDSIGRPPHFGFAVQFFLFLEHGNERRRERAFAEQPAEKIRNRKGVLEGVIDPAGAHEAVIDHLAHHAEQAAGHGGDGHRPGSFQHL